MKISTLYPNKENIVTDSNMPIPIEVALFLEESKRDEYKPNRFYFNYPAQWCTANKGESIIGVRNIYINARRRKLEFKLYVRKYYRHDFDNLQKLNPDMNIDEIYKLIEEYRKSEVSYNIVSWLATDRDLREVFSDVQEQMTKVFEEYNKYNSAINQKLKANLEKELDQLNTEISSIIYQMDNETDEAKKKDLRKQHDLKSAEMIKKYEELERVGKPLFSQEKTGLRWKRDVQMDGYYDYSRNMFIETIFSPLNEEKKSEDNNLVDIDRYNYYVDFKIDFVQRPYENNVQDNSINQIYDFVDVMNIGRESFQNDPSKYLNKWMRKIEFENVWDRHSCKVYSSFACDSSKGYLGNSQIFYDTIKYFKLNSTDQQFWIEFYSGRHSNIPITIPLNESFNIEFQFLPFHKMLYV